MAEAPPGPFRRAAGIAARRIGDALYLAETEGEAIYHLNETGAALWRMLETPATLDEVVGLFQQAFPGRDPGEIEVELAKLVRAMLDHGLIVDAG